MKLLIVPILLLALTRAAPGTSYVDDDAPGDPGPNDTAISDPCEDGSAEHPFDAIQEALDAAIDGESKDLESIILFTKGNHEVLLERFEKLKSRYW